ncbi:MAG: Uma2 family endonuclease [Microcoleaceae cyanobacterium]
MTVTNDLETLQNESEFEDIKVPPGDLESQEPPLETELHLRQLLLLIQIIEYFWQERQDFYAFGNLTIYYSPEQVKSNTFRSPDFFVVLNTDRKPRKSWVVWEEGGKYPNVIIELLSNSTAWADRTTKKEIYQDIFRTPEYFWFSPDTLEFQGFYLNNGEYEALQLNEQGRLWSKQLQLFLGVYQEKLRFFTQTGELVPTPEEAAQTAQQQLEMERQQKEKLAAKLRELGIDPETL